MASALVVRDVLERDHDAPPVARADIAIIDAAGDCRDEAKGILALDDLDWLLIRPITRIVAGHPQNRLDDLLPWAYAPEPLKAVA